MIVAVDYRHCTAEVPSDIPLENPRFYMIEPLPFSRDISASRSQLRALTSCLAYFVVARANMHDPRMTATSVPNHLGDYDEKNYEIITFGYAARLIFWVANLGIY